MFWAVCKTLIIHSPSSTTYFFFLWLRQNFISATLLIPFFFSLQDHCGKNRLQQYGTDQFTCFITKQKFICLLESKKIYKYSCSGSLCTESYRSTSPGWFTNSTLQLLAGQKDRWTIHSSNWRHWPGNGRHINVKLSWRITKFIVKDTLCRRCNRESYQGTELGWYSSWRRYIEESILSHCRYWLYPNRTRHRRTTLTLLSSMYSRLYDTHYHVFIVFPSRNELNYIETMPNNLLNQDTPTNVSVPLRD